MDTSYVEPENVDILRRVAQIVGENSAAAHALAEYERRTTAGEDVVIYRFGSRLFVGPPMTPEPPA